MFKKKKNYIWEYISNPRIQRNYSALLEPDFEIDHFVENFKPYSNCIDLNLHMKKQQNKTLKKLATNHTKMILSMETRSAKKKKLSHDHSNFLLEYPLGDDRITDLPDTILHLILFHLPIKSIAQTSILSKRWKRLWQSFPDLDFTTFNSSHVNDVATSMNSRGSCCWINRGGDFVNQVLAIRDKNCDIRVLRFRACLSFSRLNLLIRRAIKHNVQELDIEVTTNDFFNFPRSVIISESLRFFRLRSRYPGFRLPPQFIFKRGFRSLISLSLSKVIMYDQPFLVNLFDDSSFPLLNSLNLESCAGLRRINVLCRALEEFTLGHCADLVELEICCMKLKRLRVVHCFDAYSTGSRVKIEAPKLEMVYWSSNSITEITSLENLTCLSEAFLGFFVPHLDLNAAKLLSVSRFLSGISCCQFLTLESQCIEILSKDFDIGGIRQPFSLLKALDLRTAFNKHNLPGLANLFRNSPKVHTLVIRIANDQSAERREWNRDMWEISNSREEKYWESQGESMKSFLNHVKMAKIVGFIGCENDVSLIKFLLKNAKVLGEMFLCNGIGITKSRDSLQQQKIKSQIMGFSRASSNAKIVFQ